MTFSDHFLAAEAKLIFEIQSPSIWETSGWELEEVSEPCSFRENWASKSKNSKAIALFVFDALRGSQNDPARKLLEYFCLYVSRQTGLGSEVLDEKAEKKTDLFLIILYFLKMFNLSVSFSGKSIVFAKLVKIFSDNIDIFQFFRGENCWSKIRSNLIRKTKISSKWTCFLLLFKKWVSLYEYLKAKDHEL